jgi:hypothetical protein
MKFKIGDIVYSKRNDCYQYMVVYTKKTVCWCKALPMSRNGCDQLFKNVRYSILLPVPQSLRPKEIWKLDHKIV